MNENRLLRLYEEYSRKRWFSELYPDPFGELIDFLHEDTVGELAKSGQTSLRALALALSSLLPLLRFPDLYAEFKQAYAKRVNGTTPAFILYHLRRVPAEERNSLWNQFKSWARDSRTVLAEWFSTVSQYETQFHNVKRDFEVALGVDEAKELSMLERELLDSRDRFEFNLMQYTAARTLPEVLGWIRLPPWDPAADWNDFTSLEKTLTDECGIRNRPKMERSRVDPAAQVLFPISVPADIRIEYGEAAGPFDTVRFIYEMARGWFYRGFDPQMPVQYRLLGDLRLSHFWGFLYSNLLTEKPGLTRLVNPQAAEMAPQMELAVQFWIRYDTALAVFRNHLAPNQQPEDQYAVCWKSAFTMDAPHHLCLYDYNRSEESLARVLAYRAAKAAEEPLRSLYGYHWFANAKCSARLRDYWYSGYRITLNDVMNDLGIPI